MSRGQYNPAKIEKKWQRFWDKADLYRAKDFSKRKKFYLLVEFPYPSGEGLHVGHCRSYVALDVIARKRRMEGYNVLYPMGWDAFGLPTENYAIKTGIHPAKATKQNTEVFKRQEKSLGLSFDWSREINTTDPKYYKWTQWIFLQLFKKGLAYKAKMPINWCPSCKIGLANEEVVEGTCERCGAKVTQKEKEQWLLKITKYAERLIKDLNKVDFPERVVALQRDWIGKSRGWEIVFTLKCQIPDGEAIARHSRTVKVFTTRIDTILGCTYLVLSPEHPVLKEFGSLIANFKEVKQYIEKAKRKLERERLTEAKEKTGIKLEGVAAVNPANNKEIPVFVADYVMMHYGTGAIMAVPAHDQRDFDFAKKYNLPIVEVIKQEDRKPNLPERAFEGEGVLINSGEFNGLKSEVAKKGIGQWFKKRKLGRKKVYYKLRDWIFSRQRYWGEPIPLVKCQKCGWQAVPEKDLPVKLPQVKDYKPTEKGESPLATVKGWLNTGCPKCKGLAKRETDVMPNWAGSNWYFLRYCDPDNSKELASPKLLKYWLPVDWYNGGMEHATLHLLYSRFIYKFLWNIKAVPKELGSEPYKKRTSHGMVLGEGGIKMSKSKGNVINPEEVIKEYGADTLRLYEMFMGPFEQAIAWDTKGVRGVYRFLQRIYKLTTAGCHPEERSEASDGGSPEKKEALRLAPQGDGGALKKLLHKTIKKVSEDIEVMKFNTAVAALMILVNAMEKEREILINDYLLLIILLSPFAPHLAEELWQKAGREQSIFLQKWPKYDTKLIEEEKITLIIQVNGKVRDKIEVVRELSEKEAKEIALQSPKIKKWISGKEIKKAIFVKDKLINFVI